MIDFKNILILFFIINYFNFISANNIFDSYLKEYENKYNLLNNLPENHNYKIAMLGDSITAGAYWNELLDNQKVLNLGVSADQTNLIINNKKYGLISRIDNLDNGFNKAFIMIGINDFGFNKSVSSVFNSYIKIIRKIEKNNIEPVIQSTLYMTKNEFKLDYKEINKKVEKLNKLLYDYCIKNDLIYISVNTKLSNNNLLMDKYTVDGIHLNDKGYEIWSEIIKKKM
ncbi:GDSL-type esterase/lipase family protein [Halarcobacter sp.]|uniref:GDSL-type esterase/lipase family protein n=1 Tax=Halarcobacter sp. TaxID=2321133 RepID=UPI002AA95F65|nr:GDSL-type esterase/lipase family protein [Halarcobacter sp.]